MFLQMCKEYQQPSNSGKSSKGCIRQKGIANRLLLKEQFHTLRMNEGTKIYDHLSALNGIVSELESIGVKIDDEDKALRLIWSFPSSYEYIKHILMYGKDTLNFEEVTSGASLVNGSELDASSVSLVRGEGDFL
ncbi:Zinc finger, CCHC-type [Senna tora]|uniref:Zinc finger, CCHC-type n=1 Tax=Senna tora TaxID=362788 RepID=A0A835C7S4_9FABA|nr:Zinc finger, CCHC-type [Senna tora]